MKRFIPCIVILGISVLCCGALFSATIVVQGETGTDLKKAVDSAQPGDVITFNPGLKPEIILSSEITVNKSLTILGRPDGTTSIRGSNCPIFKFQRERDQKSFTIELINLTLSDGVATGENGESLGTGGGGGCGMGGAVYFDGFSEGCFVCDRVHFLNNKAVGGDGGGSSAQSNGGKGGNGSHGFNNGGEGGRGKDNHPEGHESGFFCGGGGGAGEWVTVCNAAKGGDAGYGGGGGGGGGGGVSRADGGSGGNFGGEGGWGGLFWTNAGGGGGAGLGGAIFMRAGTLVLENCEFKNNSAKGGNGGYRAGSGQGKAGAIFSLADPNSIKIYNTTFSSNSATHSIGNGFVSGSKNDTSDVYGLITSFEDIPMSSQSVTVTSALDENYGNALGMGVSLREALRVVASGGEILISESISPATLTIDAAKGFFLIEKNVKIKSMKTQPFAIDGNNSRIFFVKSGHLQLQNIKIVNAKATGSNGGFGNEGGAGGGGAAGMGGAVFVNSDASLTCEDVLFENCLAQGGKGGDSLPHSEGVYYDGAGGGGIGGDGGNTIVVRSGGIEMRAGLGGIGWPLSYSMANQAGQDGGGSPGSSWGAFGGGFGGGGGGTGFPRKQQWDFRNGGFGGGGGGSWFRGADGYSYLPVPLEGGLFGGKSPYFAGGGGAGLGGAVFVREKGTALLTRCGFTNNSVIGGKGGNPNIPDRYYTRNSIVTVNSTGQAKGGALFAMSDSHVTITDCAFTGNQAADAGEGLIASNVLVDTPDVYGVILNTTPPPLYVKVTTALDENDGPKQGTGLSLREALNFVYAGMEIQIPENISPAVLAVDPAKGALVIDKNVKITGLGKEPSVLDGNNSRVFFVKSGHLWLENIKIINANATGGNGGGDEATYLGGGGAAGMGGAVFVNSNAVLTAINTQFENCLAQGGKGGNGNNGDNGSLYGGGGGGIGRAGDPGRLNGSGAGGNGQPLSSDMTKPEQAGLDGAGGGGAQSGEGGNGGFGGGGGGCKTVGAGKGGYGGGSGGGSFKVKISGTTIVPVENPGGMFGGSGVYNGGGGGAGLGGALFARENGKIILDSCSFINNSVKGGEGGSNEYNLASSPGQGKGGSIFVMDKAVAKVRNCTFNGKSTANPGEIDGFVFNVFSDIQDIYGVINEMFDTDISAFPVVEATPTPDSQSTPTPTISTGLPTPVPQQNPLVYDFSGTTAEANQITLQGAGFGTFPQSGLAFGTVPEDNTFVNATDGKGAIIQAKPGEGIMLFLPVVSLGRAAMIRCSVRTTSVEASVYLASIDQGENVFVSTITPNNGNYFLNKWKRLSIFSLPPSAKGFQPLLQIINTSKTAPLTAYVDNFEVIPLEKGRYYSEEFLNGDETDPDSISITQEPVLPIPTPTPVISVTLTPTQVLSGTPTPTPALSQAVTVKIPGLTTDAKPLDMVLIPAGKFTMGASSNEKYSLDDEWPQHQVTITKPFYMGKYEVTQAQWQAVMGANPSHYKGENLPVEAISWEDTQVFIQKLNLMGLGTFRLPTEAEWEYACRAGTTTAFYWGADPTYVNISNYAWFYTEQLTDQTHEVGLKKPNPWGLFDMSGNVWEWCQDWYTTPYPSEPQTDPLIPTSTIGPVFRGGSWFCSPWGCRSAKRSTGESGVGFSDAGLRLVRVAQ